MGTKQPSKQATNVIPPEGDVRIGPCGIVADDRAPGRARGILSAIEELGLGELLDRATLMTSELVTNVIRHTPCRSMTLSIDVAPAELCVSVSDCDPSIAAIRSVRRRTLAGGWGLRIVDVESSRWGVYARAGGKTVWFCLPANETN